MAWRSRRIGVEHRRSRKRVPGVRPPDIDEVPRIDAALERYKTTIPPLGPGSYFISPSGQVFKSPNDHYAMLSRAGLTWMEMDKAGYVRIFYNGRYPAIDIGYQPTSAQFASIEDFALYYEKNQDVREAGGLHRIPPLFDLQGTDRVYELEDVKRYFGLA